MNQLFSLKVHVSGKRKVTKVGRFPHLFSKNKKINATVKDNAQPPIIMLHEEEPDQTVQGKREYF